MNDPGAGAESAALTHEEAMQVLRLSPEGLRRLADLDEAILELRAARRSLLANRLESIKDAFAAVRAEREGSSSTAAPSDGNGNGEQANDLGHDREGGGQQADDMSASMAAQPAGAPAVVATVARGNGSKPDADAAAAAGVLGELRMLRGEVAELRREVASLHDVSGANRELEQIQRRLTYLEAELESRHL